MAYPNNWDESYVYDAAGQMLSQLAQDPTKTPSKEILHTYTTTRKEISCMNSVPEPARAARTILT
jgi:hypothetical protein